MIRGIRVMLDVSEGELLAKARRRGISFQRLATALGLKSRQAAEQRLIKLELGSNQAENDYFEARRRARLADDSDWSNFMRWWGAGTIAVTLEGIVDENCLGGATTT